MELHKYYWISVHKSRKVCKVSGIQMSASSQFHDKQAVSTHFRSFKGSLLTNTIHFTSLNQHRPAHLHAPHPDPQTTKNIRSNIKKNKSRTYTHAHTYVCRLLPRLSVQTTQNHFPHENLPLQHQQLRRNLLGHPQGQLVACFDHFKSALVHLLTFDRREPERSARGEYCAAVFE